MHWHNLVTFVRNMLRNLEHRLCVRHLPPRPSAPSTLTYMRVRAE